MSFILLLAEAVPGGDWTPSAVTNLVTTLGFPIVVAYVVWVFLRARIESAEKSAASREEAAAVREGKLGERLDKLQDYMRTELVEVINKNTDAMCEAKDTIAFASGTINACTVALNDMRDATKRAQGVHG